MEALKNVEINVEYLISAYKTSLKTIGFIERVFKPYNLSPNEVSVLLLLNGNKELNCGELKKMLDLKGCDVSRLLNRMVKNNIISACNGEIDKRHKEFKLSRKGRMLLNYIEQKD